MPKIQIGSSHIPCEQGDNLRRVLLRAGAPVYNTGARLVHCPGLGTCGTCAVEIEGRVSEVTAIEKWRLGFPPHQSDSGLRLACQCRVEGDLLVIKHPGFWGHLTDTQQQSNEE